MALDLDDLELPNLASPNTAALVNVKRESVEVAGQGRGAGLAKRRKSTLAAPSGSAQPECTSAVGALVAAAATSATDDGALVAATSATDEMDEFADKECLGCHRSSASGRCWARPEELLQWALSGYKGLWCRDCFNLWRLNYQTRSTLVMLPCHLASDVTFEDDWHTALLAWISLRRAGHERISGPLLAERVEMVKWLMQALGVPIYGYKVVPLAELSADVAPPSAADLVTVQVHGSDQVGVMVRVPSKASGAIARPLDGSTFGLPSRRRLLSTLESDLPMLEKIFGQAVVPGAVGSGRSMLAGVVVKTEKSSPERAELPKEAKKVYQKLRAHVANAKLLLNNFEGDEWEDMKEASFTQILGKLGTSQLEAAEQQVEWMIEQASSWYHGFKDTKEFIRKHRNILRAKASNSTWDKFGELDTPISKVYDFLQKHISIGLSFTIVRIRSHFQAVSSSDTAHGLYERLTGIHSIGLFSALSAMDSDACSRLSADNWLRGLVVGQIASSVECLATDEVEEARSTLESNVKKSVSLLQTFPKPEALKEVIVDLEMFWKVCAAGLASEVVDTKSAIAAKAHIHNSARLAILAKALAESNGGLELVAPIVQMETKGVHDTLADSRFEAGLGCFSDMAMLRVQIAVSEVDAPDGHASLAKYIIHNTTLATSRPMMAPSLMTDAMSQVAEALKLWSPLRFDSMLNSLSVFVNCVGSTFVAIDIALVHHIYQACKAPIVAMSASGEQTIADNVSVLHTQTQALGLAMTPLVHSSTAELSTTFTNFAKMFKGSESLVAEVGGFAEQAAHNETARQAIYKSLGAISNLVAFGYPEGQAEAIDQWVANGEKSFLALAINLLNEVKVLKEIGALDFSNLCLDQPSEDQVHDQANAMDRGSVEMEAIVGLHMDDAGPVPIKALVHLPETVCSLQAVVFAENLLTQSVGGLVGRLGDLAQLGGIIKEQCAEEPCAASTLAEVIQKLVEPGAMLSSVGVMSQYLLRGASTAWPSVCALEMLEDLTSSKKQGLDNRLLGSSSIFQLPQS